MQYCPSISDVHGGRLRRVHVHVPPRDDSDPETRVSDLFVLCRNTTHQKLRTVLP